MKLLVPSATTSATRALRKGVFMGFASMAVFAACAGVHSAKAAVMDLGSSFTPTGANYTITPVQEINAANPAGVMNISGLSINQNVENYGALGVNYVVGSGSISQQPGINLYSNGLNSGIQSTGLQYKFNTGVAASSAGVTMLDFDLGNANNGFANSQKAIPQISLFTTNGNLITTVDPQTILHNSTFSNTSDGSLTVNLGTLLAAKGLSDQTIGSYIISAATAGYVDNHGNAVAPSLQQFKTANDPFFVGSATGGIPNTVVPEVSSFLPLIGVLGVVIGGASLRRRFAKVAPTPEVA